MTEFAAAGIVLYALLAVLAATSDVLSRRIPNWLTLLMASSFFPLAWASGMSLAVLYVHAGIGLGLLAMGFAFASLGLFGNGDGKFLAAAGLWIGPAALPDFLTWTALAGGVLALVVLAWSSLAWISSCIASSQKHSSWWPREKLPYGYAIAAGALLALPESWWSSPFPQ
jgi:prepilin peptidase CpaA